MRLLNRVAKTQPETRSRERPLHENTQNVANLSLAQLAEKLDLARSTLDVQLRRAERRLLNRMMNES